jgi:hypothetical protein
VYREVLPAFQTGEPPPFIIDLADEVSAQWISWKILHSGKDIGTARTVVRHRPDRTFMLVGEFKPNKLQMFGIAVKKLDSFYAVTRDGDLRELEAKVAVGAVPIEVGIGGTVDQGVFTPEIRVAGIDVSAVGLPKLDPVPVSGHGSVLNPLHPLNRLKGLRDGEQWVQPVMDPLAVALQSVKQALLPFSTQPPLRRLHAQVSAGALVWDGQEVACWQIKYGEPGQKPAARTWVRRSDGLVLRQEATHTGMELVLERNPPR